MSRVNRLLLVLLFFLLSFAVKILRMVGIVRTHGIVAGTLNMKSRMITYWKTTSILDCFRPLRRIIFTMASLRKCHIARSVRLFEGYTRQMHDSLGQNTQLCPNTGLHFDQDGWFDLNGTMKKTSH